MNEIDDDDELNITGPCFHCHEPCTGNDYCFGCKSLICSKCSPYYDLPSGREHAPEEHLLCLDMMSEGEFTCRRIVGERDHQHVFCGAPAILSAYCVGHVQVVIDERSSRKAPS